MTYSKSIVPAADLPIALEAVADLIEAVQTADGAIAHAVGDIADPWDHVESAMALTVCGRHRAARRAFQWSSGTQLPDGSWYTEYTNSVPTDRTRDANMSAYIAVGVYHDFLVTGDRAFALDMWPTVEAAIDFSLGLQTDTGEIHWAISPEGRVDPMALLTGSSSIYMSIKCALALASAIDKHRPDWAASLHRLGRAIAYHPHRFNQSKTRFSMDWFYPVLSGAITGEIARTRISRGWVKYVMADFGVRCVWDRPWVTVAESSELCLALAALGEHDRAATVFDWLQRFRYDDGTYWCGCTIPDLTIWPETANTWTNAAAVLAADAIYKLTPGHDLFSHARWQNDGKV